MGGRGVPVLSPPSSPRPPFSGIHAPGDKVRVTKDSVGVSPPPRCPRSWGGLALLGSYKDLSPGPLKGVKVGCSSLGVGGLRPESRPPLSRAAWGGRRKRRGAEKEERTEGGGEGISVATSLASQRRREASRRPRARREAPAGGGPRWVDGGGGGGAGTATWEPTGRREPGRKEGKKAGGREPGRKAGGREEEERGRREGGTEREAQTKNRGAGAGEGCREGAGGRGGPGAPGGLGGGMVGPAPDLPGGAWRRGWRWWAARLGEGRARLPSAGRWVGGGVLPGWKRGRHRGCGGDRGKKSLPAPHPLEGSPPAPTPPPSSQALPLPPRPTGPGSRATPA